MWSCRVRSQGGDASLSCWDRCEQVLSYTPARCSTLLPPQRGGEGSRGHCRASTWQSLSSPTTNTQAINSEKVRASSTGLLWQVQLLNIAVLRPGISVSGRMLFTLPGVYRRHSSISGSGYPSLSRTPGQRLLAGCRVSGCLSWKGTASQAVVPPCLRRDLKDAAPPKLIMRNLLCL